MGEDVDLDDNRAANRRRSGGAADLDYVASAGAMRQLDDCPAGRSTIHRMPDETDEVVDAATDWQTYEFGGKPTDPTRRPPQVAPYHLRVDWQLWFAAMSPSPARHSWYVHFLAKLLAGDPGVSSLLHTDPFPDEPPAQVRALRYRYRFTTPAERRETGTWWRRDRVGTYFGPVALDDPEHRMALRRRGWEVPD